MMIRKEDRKDYERIHFVVKTAFEKAEHMDGNEHNLVDKLRNSEAFIPELSLVAEINGEIVGHILFTQAKVNESIVLALAPLSVLPSYQGQGVGSALIKAGHHIAKALGYGYSIVLGSDKYYPKFGYFPAENVGITAPFDVSNENFMVYKLDEKAPQISGMIQYATEF